VENGMSSNHHLTVRSSRYAAYAFGLFVFAVGILLDLVLIDLGAPRRFMLLFDDLITGVVAAIAAWLIFRAELRRREQEMHRFLVLDETNHHVRNALQVMVLHAYSMEGPRAAELQHAVARIEWTLNEVLPKIGPVNEEKPAPRTHIKSA
jgi:hypothetical protein